MRLTEADLERHFAHIEAKFARAYAALCRTYSADDATFTVNGTRLEGDSYTFEMAMGDPDQRPYPGDGNRHARRKAAAERRRGRC